MKKISVTTTNIFFLCFIFSYFMLSVMVGMLLPVNMPEWLYSVVSTMVLILPAAVFLIIEKINPVSIFGNGKIRIRDIVLTYIGAYCLMPAVYLVNYITMFFAQNYVGGMIAGVYEYPLIVQLLLIAVMPAVVEEFIFRGIFFGGYVKRNPLKAAIMSGLIFGVVHLNINQFAYAFIMGFAFSILFYASNNILLPMVAHFAINANTIFTINASNAEAMLEASDAAMLTLEETPVGVLVMGGVFIAIFAVVGVVLYGIIVNVIAKGQNRQEHLIGAFKNWKVYNDESADDNNGKVGRFIDIYMILALIPAFAYMIILEIM